MPVLIFIIKQLSFDAVKAVEAHDGPIEDISFDNNFLCLASTGVGYPHVWSLGKPSYNQVGSLLISD